MKAAPGPLAHHASPLSLRPLGHFCLLDTGGRAPSPARLRTKRITSATGGDDATWLSTPAEVDNWLARIVGLHKTTATAIVRPFTYGETIMPTTAQLLNSEGAVVLLLDSLFGR